MPCPSPQLPPLAIASIDFSIEGVSILRGPKGCVGWKTFSGPYRLDERHMLRRAIADLHQNHRRCGVAETPGGVCLFTFPGK